MHVYVLLGQGRRGKTTTLKLLIDEILKNGGKIIYEANDETADRKIAMDVNGKTIGVCTAGDNENIAVSAIEFIREYNCDIAFCACKSKGKTVEKFTDFAKEGHSVAFIHKDAVLFSEHIKCEPSADKLMDEQNIAQAERLFAKIS